MASTAGGYNDSHRAFLQAFMARGSMTFEEAKPVLAAIFSINEDRETLPNDVTQPDFTQYISTVNMAISPFDLEIRSTVHQTSQTRIYALVNTTSDPLTQLATTHSADEIAYVKRVLDAMFEKNNSRRQEAMIVSEIEAVQLAKVSSSSSGRAADTQQTQEQGGSGRSAAGQSLSMKDAEAMLVRLVEEGWFEKSRKGYYTLSPRALMELKGWLVSTYNDEEDEDRSAHPRAKGGKIKFCFACGDIITMGQRCPSRQCNVRLHDICTRNFFRMHQSEKCPVCKTDWTGENFVGERAVTNSRQSQGRARNSNAGASSNVRPASGQADAAEEDSDIG